jgi:protein required for attachment to host cells
MGSKEFKMRQNISRRTKVTQPESISPRALRVLVVHRSGGRLFKVDSDEGPFTVVKRWSFPEGHLKENQIKADRPGRMKSRMGKGRSPLVSKTDPVRAVMEGTARTLSAFLKTFHDTHPHTHLILVADPTFLGLLKSKLSKSVAKSIVGTVSRDLAKVTDEEVGFRLRDELRSIFENSAPRSEPSHRPLTPHMLARH